MIASEQKKIQQNQTELILLKQSLGFDHIYVQVKSLFSDIVTSPATITKQTINALLFVIESEKYIPQKQCFFLYKEAADALIHIAKDVRHTKAVLIVHSLQKILLKSTGKRQRAVSESLGSLPVNIKGPDIHIPDRPAIFSLSFYDLLKHLDNPDLDTFTWHGRTLRYRNKDNTIGCIKFATSKKNICGLVSEVQWLLYLKRQSVYKNNIFHIPRPVNINNHIIFKLSDMPEWITKTNCLSKNYPAIIFTTNKSYYQYPNENVTFKFQKDNISEVYSRNARLLGELAAKGIIHTALIPLFHNRMQQNRRADDGIYIWEQGGRLDKWLESCRYPNFAKSGLRDFEHLTAIQNTKKLRHFIGEHLLGFFLVLGSTFRNREPNKVGWDNNNLPRDLRYIFDSTFFRQTMEAVIQNYYKGLSGCTFQHIKKTLTKKFIDKLIDAMAIDRHMEETLRIRDQSNMDDQTFYDFLISRGYEKKQTACQIRCKKDIVLQSGPHLGGFNQKISVPELINFLFCLSSMCISDRYLCENGLKGLAN